MPDLAGYPGVPRISDGSFVPFRERLPAGAARKPRLVGAMVSGTDDGQTKYRLDLHIGGDHFARGVAWAFPNEVVEVSEQEMLSR